MTSLKFSVNVTVNYKKKILQGKHKNWVLLGLDDTRRSGAQVSPTSLRTNSRTIHCTRCPFLYDLLFIECLCALALLSRPVLKSIAHLPSAKIGSAPFNVLHYAKVCGSKRIVDKFWMQSQFLGCSVEADISDIHATTADTSIFNFDRSVVMWERVFERVRVMTHAV